MSFRRVSVVIEWDNVRLAELGRARRMLAALASQAREVHRPPPWAAPAESEFLRGIAPPVEVLVTFDSAEFTVAGLDPVVRACLPEGFEPLALRYVPVPGGRYYQLKNAGAAEATGDLLVFLDSDCIPEPGWLQALLAGFSDPDRHAIGGNTYVEPAGVYGKTFALMWFFPFREEDGPLAPARTFLVNNVAFRRDTFLAHRFPLEPGLSKGACLRLAQQLLANGIPIHHAPRAHCSHPAPNGLGHFLRRGIAQGRDFTLAPGGSPIGFASSCRRAASYLGWSTMRVVQHRERVGLPAPAIPASLAIAWSYCSLYFAGSALSHVAPAWMRRRFQL